MFINTASSLLEKIADAFNGCDLTFDYPYLDMVTPIFRKEMNNCAIALNITTTLEADESKGIIQIQQRLTIEDIEFGQFSDAFLSPLHTTLQAWEPYSYEFERSNIPFSFKYLIDDARDRCESHLQEMEARGLSSADGTHVQLHLSTMPQILTRHEDLILCNRIVALIARSLAQKISRVFNQEPLAIYPENHQLCNHIFLGGFRVAS